jgi:hypothetical protein
MMKAVTIKERISDVLLVLAVFGLLIILAEQWTTQLVGFKLFELRDAIAPIWRIG